MTDNIDRRQRRGPLIGICKQTVRCAFYDKVIARTNESGAPCACRSTVDMVRRPRLSREAINSLAPCTVD